MQPVSTPCPDTNRATLNAGSASPGGHGVRRGITLAAAAAVSFTLVGCGGGGGDAIAAGEIVTAAKSEVSTTVSATGSLEPGREVALTTRLTGPVTAINVKAGDRVNTTQVLANIDTSELQRDLDAQRASQAAERAAAEGQVLTAQSELNNYQDALGQGLDPEIAGAESAARTAQEQYDTAKAKLDGELADRQAGNSESIVAAAGAVRSAREALRQADDAALNSFFQSITNQDSETGQDPGPIGAMLVNQAATDAAVVAAQEELRRAEEAYGHAVETVDRSLAQSHRDAAAAGAALDDAQRSLAATNLAAQHKQMSMALGVDQALRSADASNAAAALSNGKLQADIASSDVRSPFDGVVTSVQAAEGQAAAGPILSVADDSKLLVRAELREAQVADVKVGDKVTFTSPSARGKTFNGTVSQISPVPTAQPSGGEEGAKNSSSSTNSKPTFPVEIEVGGNRDGLRLGSTVKATITADTKRAIKVPSTAIVEENGKSFVTIVDGDTVEKREVKVEVNNGIDAGISGDIKEGDKILTQGAKYLPRVGQPAKVSGDADVEGDRPEKA